MYRNYLRWASRLGLAAVILTLPLLGQAVDYSVKVMSFNIRYGTAEDGDNAWQYRRDLVYQNILDDQPDILTLQEALRFQLNEIHLNCPGYDEVGVGRTDGVSAGEYAAILFRASYFDLVDSGTFWFSDTPGIPGSKSWGNQIPRICTWAKLLDLRSSNTLMVFNVHLDHESQWSRMKSVMRLAWYMRKNAEDYPIILTGDFNTGESSDVIRFIKRQTTLMDEGDSIGMDINFVDPYRQIHPDVARVGTYNYFRGIDNEDKIDYIFVNERWDILDADIVRRNFNGRYPSDHFPVTATVRVR